MIIYRALMAEHARFGLTVTSSLLFLSIPAVSSAISPVLAINDEAKTAQIQATPVSAGLTVLSGSGGNITVLSSGGETLLIDSGISYSRAPLQKALDALGAQAIRYVINTHYHWDHSDGNAWLHELGATIMAHENTVKHLSMATRVDDWEWTFPPTARDTLPSVVVRDAKTLHFHASTIELRHYAPSHTDSDVSAYFIEANVLCTGDTFWNGYYPFIDNENGGSIDGMIRATESNVAKAGRKTIVVPGHGPLGGHAELVEFRDMLVAIRQRVAAMKQRGLSRDEAVAAKPTREFDSKWGGFVIDGGFFTRLVFDGL